jgi:hypothetical protein
MKSPSSSIPNPSKSSVPNHMPQPSATVSPFAPQLIMPAACTVAFVHTARGLAAHLDIALGCWVNQMNWTDDTAGPLVANHLCTRVELHKDEFSGYAYPCCTRCPIHVHDTMYFLLFFGVASLVNPTAVLTPRLTYQVILKVVSRLYHAFTDTLFVLLSPAVITWDNQPN